MSEFAIVAYREFRDTAIRIARNSTTVIRMWNRWVQESCIERHYNKYPRGYCEDVWSSTDYLHGDSSVQNNKARYRSGTTSSFLTSSYSACNIMMQPCLEAPRMTWLNCIRYCHMGHAPSVTVWQPLDTRTFLVNVVGNLNNQCYISQILRMVAVPYLQVSL
ncbi:hypothetical protein TNCV_2745561 [Trichonephila clavipes]|nr:hypothetical protein TNCV_2745561 [Trichonephila clavipes]